jgi:hypothetical protein
MTGHTHNGLELLSAEEVESIYQVTDRLDLHRDWVVVPLNCAKEGLELQQPDGKILIRAPGKGRFESWLRGLRERVGALDLGRVPRPSNPDPKRSLTGPAGPRFFGTRRYLVKHVG